jgi:hypothetical protein
MLCRMIAVYRMSSSILRRRYGSKRTTECRDQLVCLFKTNAESDQVSVDSERFSLRIISFPARVALNLYSHPDLPIPARCNGQV